MKTTKQLLSDANSSSNKISKIEKQKEIQEEKISKSSQLLHSQQYDETHKVEDKYRALQKILDNKKEKDEAQFKKEFDDLDLARNNLRKTIYFLRADKDKKIFDAGKITNSEHYGLSPKVNRLYAYKDEFLSLSYIMYNVNRPKNKVALCIIGYCKIGGRGYGEFEKDVLEVDYIYGSHLEDQAGANFIHEVKFLPDQESAKEYARKNPIKKVVKNFLSKYELVKKECLEISKNYSLADFEEYRLGLAKKYFDSHNHNLSFFAEHHNIKKTVWEKLTITEKIKVMEIMGN